MSIDAVLLPELIARIGTTAGPTTAFALRYVSKTTHVAIQLYDPKPSPYEIIIDAIGNLDMIKWLFSMGCTAKNIYAWQKTSGCESDKSNQDNVCAMAARHGDIDSLRLLRKNGFLVHRDDPKYAIRHDNVKIIKCLLAEPSSAVIDQDTIEIIVARECFDLLSWAYDTAKIHYHWAHDLCCVASSVGSVKIIRWCFNHIIFATDGVIKYAAYNGHLYAVKCLCTMYEREKMNATRSAIRAAYTGGHEHILDWFRSIHVDVDSVNITPVRISTKFDVKSPEFIVNKYAAII